MKVHSKVFCLLILLIITTETVSFAADYSPSNWSKSYINTAANKGIKLTGMENEPYNTPITRVQFCNLMLQFYNYKNETEYVPKSASPYIDTKDKSVIAMHELGIVSGVKENIFEPDRNVTRQESAKMLFNVSKILYNDQLPSSTDNLKIYFDEKNISSWARPYISVLTDKNIIKGDENGNFNPIGNVTVEQSVAMLVRLFGFDIDKIVPEEVPISINGGNFSEGIFKINCTINKSNMIKVKWDSVSSGNSYNIEIIEQRDSRHAGDIAPNKPIIQTLSGKTEYNFKAHPNLIYKITVSAGTLLKDTVTFTTKMAVSYEERKSKVYPNGEPKTEDKANALMETISVKGWVLKNNQKVSSTFTLTVNSAISDVVKQIFDEIYNGDEKFPIISLGAYSWREPMSGGRLSEHNLGTAIDINSDENYCLYSDGSTSGKFWLPYENQYSITPYGNVIRTFEKFGFTWGGDSWSSPKDYMHFSYFGT